MKKITPTKTITNIAHTPKGIFMFKTNSLNQFYPYELLNYTQHPSIIIPLRRTASGMHHLLEQHGYDLSKTHFIDVISKHISSPLVHKRATHLHKTTLRNLAEEIEKKARSLSPGPKTLFIDDVHTLIPHYGELKTKRFLDFLSKRMQSHMAKTVMLADHKKLPKQVSKYLFTTCDEIIEIPK